MTTRRLIHCIGQIRLPVNRCTAICASPTVIATAAATVTFAVVR